MSQNPAYVRWYAKAKRDPVFVERRRARQRAQATEVKMIRNARQRAKRAGVPCTITAADILIPETCPILGIALKIGTRQPTDNSPSLDRIEPAKGYVQGNIAVISFRANAIKNCASVEELQAVVEWLNRVTLT